MRTSLWNARAVVPHVNEHVEFFFAKLAFGRVVGPVAAVATASVFGGKSGHLP